MFKKKHFSVYNDLRTGFLYKFSIVIGFFLLFIFIFINISSLLTNGEITGFFKLIYDFSQSNFNGSIFAFSILFLFIGGILYFLHRQFLKLAKLANEIENELEIEDSK